MTAAPPILGPGGPSPPRSPPRRSPACARCGPNRSPPACRPSAWPASCATPAEPGGDTRDYLTLAEEIEEREPQRLRRRAAASRPQVHVALRLQFGETHDAA